MSKQPTRVDWNDIPLLLAIWRERQLRAASRQLGVDSSTVSRRLAAAEERLQARLFIRDPDGYKPTDAGRAFIEAAEAIERKVLGIFSVARDTADEISGPVRITSVDALLNDWLTARLPSLMALYPGLQIQLTPDNRNLSFSRSEADLALRLARPEADASILMKRVGRVAAGVYGHPKFKDVTPGQWNELPWVTYNDDLSNVAEMHWLRRVVPQVNSQFKASSIPLLLKACEAGLGIGLLPCISVRGAGVVQLSDGAVLEREIWLLTHRDNASVRRFRVVADWLAAQILADDSMLAGEGRADR